MDQLAAPAGRHAVNIRIPATVRIGVLAGLIGVVSLSVACSGRQPAGDEKAERAKTRVPPPSLTGTAACFYARQVQDFEVLNRSNLIVYAPNDRHAYHVLISPPSVELRWANALAFLPANDRICGYAGERLVIPAAGTGQSPAIVAVSRLSPEGLETLRGGADVAAPVVPAQPGQGAEIEELPESPADGTQGEKADSESEN